MRSILRPSRVFLVGAIWCSLALGAAAQEADEPPPSPYPAEVDAKVTAILDAIDLTPQPLPEIPDNPPPHEGAMIDPPEYRIEPPDLVLIEVLEALPGRPISGERLVRPDGTISLGFYGDVHVRGLTIKQAKIKILKHLRRYLVDEVLGLLEPAYESKRSVEKPSIPDAVEEDHPSTFEFGPDETIKVVDDAEKPKVAEKPREILIQVGDGVSIRVDVKKRGEPESQETPEAEKMDYNDPAAWRPVPPDQSIRIFVDVTAYNSKIYHVMGDAPAAGKLPFTGNETVLDALHYAGGLLPTADPSNIRLVRPGRDGKPAKIYPVDLEGIRDRGETATNYQIFPGDRLIIGRDKVVEKTIQIDRLYNALETIIASIQREAEMNKKLDEAFVGRSRIELKRAVEFWIREMNRPDGAVLDEDILRDALLRRFQAKPEESEKPKDEE